MPLRLSRAFVRRPQLPYERRNLVCPYQDTGSGHETFRNLDPLPSCLPHGTCALAAQVLVDTLHGIDGPIQEISFTMLFQRLVYPAKKVEPLT